MNSLYHLRDAIKCAIIENKHFKNFIIFNHPFILTMENDKKYRVTIEEIAE